MERDYDLHTLNAMQTPNSTKDTATLVFTSKKLEPSPALRQFSSSWQPFDPGLAYRLDSDLQATPEAPDTNG